MPSRQGLRALKAWRYVGVYGPELMLCIGSVRVGPAHQTFWAVWDRTRGVLHERTTLGGGTVRLAYGRARVVDGGVSIDLALEETAGIESVCPSGQSYAWTRKQAGIRAVGTVHVPGATYTVDARAVIDDTAAYYERRTSWRWCAGVGVSADGHRLAWNLVAGVNDPPRGSERSVWVDGVAHEAAPADFNAELSAVDGLRFSAEAVRERHENLGLVRSSYRQPFGTFAGVLPGGHVLADGYGVMEQHEARW